MNSTDLNSAAYLQYAIHELQKIKCNFKMNKPGMCICNS